MPTRAKNNEARASNTRALDFEAPRSPYAVAASSDILVSGTLVNNNLLTVDGTVTNYGTVTNPGLILLSTGASQLAGTSPLNALTFDANGGKGTFTVAEPGNTFDMTKLATFSMEPTWAGHTFLGWSTQRTGGTPVASPHTFADGDTLYAVWGTAPSITTASLPAGKVGTAYNQALAATGTTPITWSLDAGALPPGLALSPAGVISGTPTTAGSYTFTVKATNASGDDTKQLSITITATPPAVYQVNLTQTPGGTATATPTKAAAGAKITLSALPHPGSSFVKWEVSPTVTWTTGSATSEKATFTMPASDVKVVPQYKPYYYVPPKDATISPTLASFNLNKSSGGFSDITITLAPGDHSVLALRLDGRDLQEGSQYTVSGNTYTILSAFLATLPVGQHTVVFAMSGGTDPTLTITITDTRPAPPPLTGDHNNQPGWSTLLLAALLGLTLTAAWGRRLHRPPTMPARPNPKHLAI